MEEIRGSALWAEAQPACADSQCCGFAGLGTITQQPAFRPVRRRDLMAALNTLSRDLGLRSSGVMVLDALLSCLPCKEQKTGVELPISPNMLLTVFAANETLCFRAKGITERQLRRHLERFEQIGLIERRDSANGKRFPVQRGGKIIGAFGIDLSPLLARSHDMLTRAAEKRNEIAELRGLRACIQSLRARCLALELDDATHAFVDGLRNVLRRVSLTRIEARQIMERLRGVLLAAEPKLPAAQDAVADLAKHADTDETPGTDGQNVRHKEPEDSETKKIAQVSVAQVWANLPTLSVFYPDIPRSVGALRDVLHDFAQMLRIDQLTLTRALTSLGLETTLKQLDRIAEQADRIEQPDRYFLAVLRDHGAAKVGHGQVV